MIFSIAVSVEDGVTDAQVVRELRNALSGRQTVVLAATPLTSESYSVATERFGIEDVRFSDAHAAERYAVELAGYAAYRGEVIEVVEAYATPYRRAEK